MDEEAVDEAEVGRAGAVELLGGGELSSEEMGKFSPPPVMPRDCLLPETSAPEKSGRFGERRF